MHFSSWFCHTWKWRKIVLHFEQGAVVASHLDLFFIFVAPPSDQHSGVLQWNQDGARP